MSKINQAVQAALNTIEDCKRRILMFEYAIRGMKNDSVISINSLFETSVEVIHSKLYQKLNDAYSVLFMWGNIVPPEAMKEARKAAFKGYLKESDAIMQYLDMNLESPGCWDSKEEEEFRAEIEQFKNE